MQEEGGGRSREERRKREKEERGRGREEVGKEGGRKGQGEWRMKIGRKKE